MASLRGVTLRDIKARFDGKLALNCAVLTQGTIALGDTAEVLEG